MAKNSEARINANARYNAKTYKRFAINTRLEYVDAIEQYKIKNNIASDSGIFNAAIMYCIKHNIDLTENDTWHCFCFVIHWLLKGLTRAIDFALCPCH